MDPDEPQYGAADVAVFLGEKERRVRDLHDRGFAGFFGRRDGYRVLYSLRDIAGASVARDLVQLGFAPRLAARVGAVTCYRDPHPETVLTGSPAQIAAITPAPGSGFVHDRQTYVMPPDIPSTISIPIGRIWRDVIEKAGRLRHARAA